jgi:hypothetical protein
LSQHQERGLESILGGVPVPIAQDPPANREDHRPMSPHERSESVPVPQAGEALQKLHVRKRRGRGGEVLQKSSKRVRLVYHHLLGSGETVLGLHKILPGQLKAYSVDLPWKKKAHGAALHGWSTDWHGSDKKNNHNEHKGHKE